VIVKQNLKKRPANHYFDIYIYMESESESEGEREREIHTHTHGRIHTHTHGRASPARFYQLPSSDKGFLPDSYKLFINWTWLGHATHANSIVLGPAVISTHTIIES